jgi:hypothetical protein
MDPLTMSLIAAGGSAIGALPDIIPSKYERDQKKRLQEMQRKQEMGALGLTKAERDAIEGQMRGARRQAQQYADAERARLTQPTAQPQMALLGQQMADEGRQRLEADLASQILGMDLSRQAEQEQEIKDLQAAQAQYKRARAEGLTAPFQVGAETAVGQMGLERLLGNYGKEPVAKEPVAKEPRQRMFEQQYIRDTFQDMFPESQMTSPEQSVQLPQTMGEQMPIGMSRQGATLTPEQVLTMPPAQQYTYMKNDLGMSDDEMILFMASVSNPIKPLGVKASDVAGTSFGLY